MILYNELNWYIITNQTCALCNSFYYIYFDENKRSEREKNKMYC